MKIEKGLVGISNNINYNIELIPLGKTLYFIKYDDMSVGYVKLSEKFLEVNNLDVYELFSSEEMRDMRFAEIAIDEDAEFKSKMFSGEEILEAFKNNPMAEKSTEYLITRNSIINYLKK